MKGKADASKKGEGRLKAAGGAGKRKKAAASGKPKRPPSAFFVFMSEFRQEYQAQNPNNKSVANVSKAAGEKWRSMSEEDKAPYVEKAGQKKQDYEKSKATSIRRRAQARRKLRLKRTRGKALTNPSLRSMMSRMMVVMRKMMRMMSK
ncbi:hypothetical protein GUJ93_ZPchr0006g40646 [Zizania palustris]|uniref:HMG box domain-containing protein n=1 Tax=Zizania palustris TaxID=103762 RepID=A0A8J5TCK3_ZIZPA|nr:hypothetical protein GUJ93_ZPchr0006g40646 [Zizania palustris]